MADETTSDYTMSLTVQNWRKTPMTLRLEPWEDRFDMPPNVAFQVVARAPVPGALDVGVYEDELTVWGWTGSIASVYRDGAELVPGRWENGPAVPVYPPQIS